MLLACARRTLRRSSTPGYADIVMSDAEKGIKDPAVYKTDFPKESPFITENISIAPNPFSSGFILSINSKQNAKARINIYNAVGVKVKDEMKVNFSKGINKIPFDGINLLRISL